MKKMITALMIGTLLTGCAIEESGTTAITTSPTPDTAWTASGDDIYLATVKMEYPAINATLSDQWLLEFADTTCAAMDEGMTIEELAIMVIQEEVDPTLIGYLMGAAVYSFCDRHSGFFD